MVSLSDCSGRGTDGNAGSEKQEWASDNQKHTCEVLRPSETKNCLNYEHTSFSDCSKENSNSYTIMSGKTSGLVGNYNELAGNVNPQFGFVTSALPQAIHSMQKIYNTSVATAGIEQTLHMEKIKSVIGRMDGYWVDFGKDLKPVMQERFHGMHLKDDSSTSNSTHVVLPGYSNDSCQEPSVGAKLSKHSNSRIGTSSCTGFSSTHKEPVLKNSTLDMKIQTASQDVVADAVSSLEKQTQASEIVDHEGPRNCDGTHGKSAGHKCINMDKIDRLKSYHSKMNCAVISNQGKTESCVELDDALEVATRVAREVEQEVGWYREASGNSYSVEEKNEQTLHSSSSNSTDRNIGYRMQSCNEKDKGEIYCCTKEMINLETTMRNEHHFLEGNKPSGILAPKTMDEVPEGCDSQESSYMADNSKRLCIRKTESQNFSAVDQCSRLPKIDLNEDILANEAKFPCPSNLSFSNHVENLSKPIPVVAKSGSPICLSVGPSQSGEVLCGWKGSAATSAFRPTSHFKSFDRNKASSACDGSDSPEQSNFKGIDLNIAAEIDSEVDILSEKHLRSQSSFHSEESSLGFSSTRGKKINIDLNSVNENDDFSGQSSNPVPLKPPSIRDFDLNDNPLAASVCRYSDMPTHGRNPSIDQTPADPAALHARNARSLDCNGLNLAYLPNMTYWQSCNAEFAKSYLLTAPGMVLPAQQMQIAFPVQQKVPCAPQLPPLSLHYSNGFYIDPNKSFGILPYVVKPQGVNVVPHIPGSSTLPVFPGGAPNMDTSGGKGPSGVSIMRPEFHPNDTMAAENANRYKFTRQFIPENKSSMAGQINSVRQATFSSTAMKRREPEGGWDSSQFG